MTLADYEELVHLWCGDVERQAIELFRSGVQLQDCTGLAITLVESRRKKTSADQSRLAVPAPFPIVRN